MQRLGGVGYILTCTEINFHPIVKPFEMGAYWGVMKRSIFLFDHRMFASWDFRHFSKKFDKKLALGAAESVKKNSKNFQKIEKWWNFFFFIFVFIMFYWMYRVTQTWYDVQKPIFIPTIQSEDSSNYVLKMMWKSIKIIKKSKIWKIIFDGK